MFRSIWFWVILAFVGLAIWLGRDQIASFFAQLPMTAPERTTNTQALAGSPQAAGVQTTSGSGGFVTVTPGSGAQTTASSTGVTTYVVQKGDTLYSISKAYNTTVAELQQLNGISDPTTLSVGQVLKVPAPMTSPQPAQPVPAEGTVSYTVKKGDTLYSISRQFNTSVDTLQQINNLPDPGTLTVGMVLQVPAPATAATAIPESTPAAAASPTPPPPPTPTPTVDQEVHSLPVLAEGESAQATPIPPATPTLIAPAPSICEGTEEAAFVWGVSLCVPNGWTLTEEYAGNDRTAWVWKDEAGNDRSLYAISRLDGSPNAPLSYSMRQAKAAVSDVISDRIPGGLAEPEEWSQVTDIKIDDNKAQVSEADTIYLGTGHKAHVRVIVFNHNDQRWRIVMVAPKDLWQKYDTTVFPYITKTLDVF